MKRSSRILLLCLLTGPFLAGSAWAQRPNRGAGGPGGLRGLKGLTSLSQAGKLGKASKGPKGKGSKEKQALARKLLAKTPVPKPTRVELDERFKVHFTKSPQALYRLMHVHMVRMPYTSLVRDFRLGITERDRALDLLEVELVLSYKKHRHAIQLEKPEVSQEVARMLENIQTSENRGAEGRNEDAFEPKPSAFDFLPLTTISKLADLVPDRDLPRFHEQLGTDQRIQLAMLAKRRALAFKLQAPKARAAFSSARPGRRDSSRGGFQSFGEGNSSRSGGGLFGRGGRGGGRRGGRGGLF